VGGQRDELVDPRPALPHHAPPPRGLLVPPDPRPIEPGCLCPACRQFSRGYLRHLFLAEEMLGPILASGHNLAYMHRLTRQIREAIRAGRFAAFREEALSRLGP
jgi:queuine tRNA-ribosyltransferase